MCGYLFRVCLHFDNNLLQIDFTPVDSIKERFYCIRNLVFRREGPRFPQQK